MNLEAAPERDTRSKNGVLLALPFVMVGAVVFAADQATKQTVSTLIDRGDAVSVTSFFRITHVTNTGSAFGLLQGQSGFLMLASVIGVLAVIFYYRANGRESLLLRVALGLVMGGALGNFADRLFRGAVVDFIDVQIWSGFHWPSFNIADSSLLIGLAMLAFYVMRQREPRLRGAIEQSSMPVTDGDGKP